jgi:competence protein ComEC
LAERRISDIDYMLISHADSDHVGGALDILASPKIRVRRLFLNGDWFKSTKTWKLLRQAVQDARTRSQIEVHTELSSALGATIVHGEIVIEVLAPSPELLLGSADRKDLKGRRLSSNSLSAVIRVLNTGEPIAIFTGDLDRTGFENLAESGKPIRASTLVFPHHGGHPGAGGDVSTFAENLCDLVHPDLVVFSIAREGHSNPRPEILSAVRKRVGGGRVACTQLSRHCSPQPPPGDDHGHLSDVASAGAHRRLCCAGTLAITASAGEQVIAPTRAAHLAFIERRVPTPMCISNEERQAPPMESEIVGSGSTQS